MDLRALVTERTAELPEGEPLDPVASALVQVALASAVTRLSGIEDAIARARTAGVTDAQLEEIVTLVAGLGVHSLMRTVPLLVRERPPRTPAQHALWTQFVGDSAYWQRFEEELPGFLDALLRLSPITFAAFFDWCAVPWKGRAVPTRTKELVSLAVDATREHTFEPGFRLHLRNAIELGVGRRAILEAFDLAQA